MKKVFKLFVICSLILCLAVFGIGCKKEQEKEFEIANLDSALLGVYYDLNGQEAQVAQNNVSVNDVKYVVLTNGEKYVARNNEKDLDFTFGNGSITIDTVGTFTKRTLAKVAEDKQAVYADSSNPSATLAVREESITLGGKTYKLFEDENGVYYLNGKQVYLVFTTALTLAAVTVEDKTYVITAAPLPAEEGELTKLLREIVEKVRSNEARNYAFQISGNAKTSQTILTGEKDPNKIDLIGAILGDLEATLTASVNVRDLSLTDLSNTLGELLLAISIKVAGEERSVNVQANVQDGHIYVKEQQDDDLPNLSIEDLPSPDELSGEYLGDDTFDVEELFAQVAALEAQLAELGISYSDIKPLISTIFDLTKNGLKIDITKSKLHTAFLAVKMFIISKESEVAEFAWEMMDEEEKAEYENSFDKYVAYVDKELLSAFAEMDKILEDITINKFKLEVSFDTFETVVDIDFVLPGEDKAEDGEGNETVICTYETSVQVTLEATPVESKEITKVNPDDYIIKLSDMQAFLSDYLPEITYPEFSSDVEFERSVSKYDDEQYLYARFKNLTEEETNNLLQAVCTALDIEVSEYIYETLIDDENVCVVSIYKSSVYGSDGSVEGYNFEISLRVKENNLAVITPVIEEGITVEFELTSDGKVYCDKYLSAQVSWTAEDKVVYVYCDNQLIDICEYNDNYIMPYIPFDTTLEFKLGEEDESYKRISFDSDYNVYLFGPKRGKSGEQLTYKVFAEANYDGSENTFDVYCGETLIASGLKDGDEFTLTVPEEYYCIIAVRKN